MNTTTINIAQDKFLGRLSQLATLDPCGAAVKAAFLTMQEVLSTGTAMAHELFVEQFASVHHLHPEGIQNRLKAAYIAVALLEAQRHGTATASARLGRATALLEEFTDADF